MCKLVKPSLLQLAGLALMSGVANAATAALTPREKMASINIKNSNTLIDLEVIAEESLALTVPGFVQLDAFFSDYSDELKTTGDVVKVMVPSDYTAASVSGGYSISADSTETEIVVTLDKNKGVVTSFTDAQMRKGKDYIIKRFGGALKSALRTAILTDVLALIPDADEDDDYTTMDIVKTAANFTWDFLSDQYDAFDTAKLGPDRAFICKPTYMGNLRKDAKVAAAIAGGNPELIKRGYIGEEIAGWKPGKSTFLPAGVNLTAALFTKEALVFAVAQQYTPEDAGVEVLNLKDEELGVWVQYRRWYEKLQKKWYMTGEALYGVKRGIPAALQRIKSA